MIDTGNYYNDIVANVVAILDRDKDNIGVKQVFGSVPPFIGLDLFPVICVTRQTKTIDNIITVPARIRPEVIIEIWLQWTEINQAIITAVTNDITYAARIEDKIGKLTYEIEKVLRKNRDLDGYCLEAKLQTTDFRYRQSPARPQTIVAGAVINLLVVCKAIDVT